MAGVDLYNEKELARLVKHQVEQEWDLETSLDWRSSIDLQRPLVPLDEHALFFPGASAEQRLAISQMMGLVIAASVYEMEESLIRLKKLCWEEPISRYPVSPEFQELGERFFIEEQKHSEAFKRYVERYAEALGVDFESLSRLLPKIEGSKTEAILRANLKTGGQTFWWIVATVEQQFLLMYHAIRPYQDLVEPLYYQLHEKHFEEEARHSPFPYLLVEWMTERNESWLSWFHKKGDLVVAQFLQTFWSLNSLLKSGAVQDLRGRHPFFDVLATTIPILKSQPFDRILWRFLTSAPYVSSLVNLQCHKKTQRFAERMGALQLPYPLHREKKLLKY